MITAFLSSSKRTDFNGGEQHKHDLQHQFVDMPTNKIDTADKKDPPNFAPFTTTSRRVLMGEGDVNDDTPAPGTYNVGTSLQSEKLTVDAFKSKTKRFVSKEDQRAPPPGTYALGSTIKSGHKKVFPKPYKNSISTYVQSLETASHVPSIPTKSQSYGYQSFNGHIIRNKPKAVGFSGADNDKVGPMDYDPKVDSTNKFAGVRKATLNTSGRNSLDRARERNAKELPGPGYYSVRSSFDLLAQSTQNETDVVARLNTFKKKESSFFASKSVRNSLQKEIAMRASDPGPGEYAVAKNLLDPLKGFKDFSTSGSRFKAPSQSMRVNTAPGQYSILGQFDKNRIDIVKNKKMRSRSGWAQTIAFAATKGRAVEFGQDNGVPAPTAYKPKGTFSDQIQRQKASGNFGGTEIRFKEPVPLSNQTKEQIIAKKLNDDIAPYLPAKVQKKLQKSKFQMNLVPPKDNRFEQPKLPDGPPPGTYDIVPKWDKRNVVMVPESKVSRKKPVDETQVPGPYNVPGIVDPKKWKNRANVMIGTSNRTIKEFEGNRKGMPGPGAYDPRPLYNNMIKPSHNIYLSNKY